jgi:hypothetical protein
MATRKRELRQGRSQLLQSVNWLPPQPKIDALRQYKEEILKARRSGLNVHRIAQIFRERGVQGESGIGISFRKYQDGT